MSSRFGRYTEPISPAPPHPQSRGANNNSNSDVRSGDCGNALLPPGMEGLNADSHRSVQMMRTLFSEVTETIPDVTTEELRAIYDMDDDQFARFAQNEFQRAFDQFNATTKSELRAVADLNAPAGVRIYSGASGPEHTLRVPQLRSHDGALVSAGDVVGGVENGNRLPAVKQQQRSVPPSRGPLADPATPIPSAGGFHSSSDGAPLVALPATTGAMGRSDDSRPSDMRPTPHAVAEGVKIFGSPPEFDFNAHSPREFVGSMSLM